MSEYDSAEWQQKRNELLHKWVQNPYAVEFILTIGMTGEIWDDLIDGDKQVPKNQINKVFMALTTELPLNPFFDQYKLQLIPIMIAGANAWQDSTELESGTDNDKAMAYVLRDWYVELIMFVVYLTRGSEAMRATSLEIRRFFSEHESLEQYMEKLP